MTQHFNATEEVSKIREQRAVKRRRAYQRSRMARFRFELVALRKQGASYREIVLWLRRKRIKVVHTTVMDYLHKLPELQEK